MLTVANATESDGNGGLRYTPAALDMQNLLVSEVDDVRVTVNSTKTFENQDAIAETKFAGNNVVMVDIRHIEKGAHGELGGGRDIPYNDGSVTTHEMGHSAAIFDLYHEALATGSNWPAVTPASTARSNARALDLTNTCRALSGMEGRENYHDTIPIAPAVQRQR
jgi:hypothetical protein